MKLAAHQRASIEVADLTGAKMDAPKCKICGERHYGMCPTGRSPTDAKPAVAKAGVPPKLREAKALTRDANREMAERIAPRSPLSEASQQPERRKPKAENRKRSTAVESVEARPEFVCPVCEARKKAKAKAMKKWRGRQAERAKE